MSNLKMNKLEISQHKLITYFIAFVWFSNGLFCKILNFVPRHEQIVGKILGNEFSHLLIILIGCSEIVMAIWILSRYKSRLNAILQMIIVFVMNILEFSLAPELLLWGKLNFFFAMLFIALVYYNEFVLSKKITKIL